MGLKVGCGNQTSKESQGVSMSCRLELVDGLQVAERRERVGAGSGAVCHAVAHTLCMDLPTMCPLLRSRFPPTSTCQPLI